MGLFTPFAYIKNATLEPSVVYDVDAQNFFTATGITNTGLKGAVNDFVVDLKNNSLWTLMDIIYPFVGDDTSSLATQLSYNLKNTGSYQATLVNGVGDSDFGGYASNAAATRYINTNYIPRTVRGITGPIHTSIYTTTAGETVNAIDYGGFVSNSAYTYMIVGRSLSGGNSQKQTALRPDSFAAITNTAVAGYYIGGYNSAETQKSYLMINGTVAATTTATGTNGLSTISSYFGAWNDNGSPGNRATKKYQLLTVGAALSQTNAATLNTIVQNFQTAVDTAMGTNRKV